jgi:hypothetical protein
MFTILKSLMNHITKSFEFLHYVYNYIILRLIVDIIIICRKTCYKSILGFILF